MKILLIRPKHISNVKIFGHVVMNPLTLPTVAAAIPKDVEVSCIDENVEEVNFSTSADLIGISIMTAAATRGYEIADEFRRRGKPVVLGGVHPSLNPEEAAQHADVVVIGEVEGLWEKVISDFKEKKLQKFYCLPTKPDMRHFKKPRWDLLKRERYIGVSQVETSRGCPYNCSFCSTTKFFGRKMRYRPIEEIIREIKELKTKFVFFTDNNIVGNIRKAKELFKGLTPLKIKWLSQGSIHMAKDKQLLNLARKSGCVGMLIGFESLSERAISGMGKKVNQVKEYTKAIKQIHRNKIGIVGCFVFGFDEEDGNIVKRTVKFIKKMNIAVPQITVLTPFPGTEIREKFEKAGRIIHNAWYKYDGVHVVFHPQWAQYEELKDRFEWAYKKIYSYRAILWRTIKSYLQFKSFYHVRVFFQMNIVYKKIYKASLDNY